MAHWFHRNLYKATTLIDFDSVLIHRYPQSNHLCSQLKVTRQGLLLMFPDVCHSPESIEAAFLAYFSLLRGLITDPMDETKESKLRYGKSYKWTNSLLGNTPQVEKDSIFEAACMSLNVAFWYMKHASMIAGKDDISLDEAKDVHTCLRKAAGMFQFIQTAFLPQLALCQIPGSDIDPRVTMAYLLQCTAEAQEVTLARAVELKHNPSLISALASETSKIFSDASASLGPVENAVQWKLYLQLKSAFYKAFAFKYCGENLLAQDKCGEAIRALHEAQTCYTNSLELCKEYSKKKGPAPKASPDNHPFFQRFSPQLKLTLEKCERENGFIYHQKVPLDPPVLDEKATYGLVNPVDFVLPERSALWTPETYAAFGDFSSKSSNPDTAIPSTKAEKELPPVKEIPVHQTSKEPKTESGCNLQ